MTKSVLAIILGFVLSTPLSAQELLTNGGFEHGLESWSNPWGKTASLATDRVHSGTNSVRISHPQAASSIWLQEVHGLEVGAVYRVTAHVYRDAETVAARLWLHTDRVSKGAPRHRSISGKPAEKTNLWESLAGELQTNPNGVIWVHVAVEGKGDVWIDDVSLTLVQTREQRQAELARVIASATATDDEKAAAHLDLGHLFLWGNHDAASALPHYQQALELAAADASKRITALSNLAEIFAQQRDFPNSLQSDRELLALDPEGRAEWKATYGGRHEVMLAMADVYRRQQDYDNALAWYHQLLPLLAENKVESRRILLNIVDTCRQKKDFAQALAAARTIIDHWSAPDTPERAADVARTGEILLEEADRAALGAAAVREKLESAGAVFAGVRDLCAKLDPAGSAKQISEYKNRIAMIEADLDDRQRGATAAPADRESVLITREVFPFSNASFEENLKDWGGSTASNAYTTGTAAFNPEVNPGIELRSAEIAAAGRKSMVLVLPQAVAGPDGVYLPRTFTLKRGVRYYASLSIKAEGAAYGAFRLVSGASGDPTSRIVEHDAGWQQVGLSFIGDNRTAGITHPDPDTSYIELRCQAFGQGKVYFDDLHVYEVKPVTQCIRFKLLEPTERCMLVMYSQVSYPDRFLRKEYFAEAGVFPGEFSPWIDLGADNNFWGNPADNVPQVLSAGLQFETLDHKKCDRINVEVQFAYGPSEKKIIKTLTEKREGNILGVYLPRRDAAPGEFEASFRPLLDNVRERNALVKSLNLPPARLKHYFVKGFLSGFGTFFSDPKIMAMEVNTCGQIGFSVLGGYSGLTGEFRKLAAREGIVQTDETHRMFNLPVDATGTVEPYLSGREIILRWDMIEKNIADSVAAWVANIRKEDPERIPLIKLVDIGDEISGFHFAGPEYDAEFRRFLKERNFSPTDFGKANWEAVKPGWWGGIADPGRPKDKTDIAACRHFYWSLKFWSWCTARVYRIMTDELAKHLPGVPTRVNFGQTWHNAATDLRGTDVWEFARWRSVTSITNEDWLNTYGWRWAGIQLLAYQTDLNRSCAELRGLQVGAMVMPEHEEAIQLKMASAIGKGAKQIDLFCYGPAYASPDNWSENFSQVKGVAKFVRALEKAEDVLYPGQPRPAKVAIIWSQSDEIWRTSQDAIFDQMFIYLALLHNQIPIDFIDEVGLEEGRLDRYQVVYLCGRNLSRHAQQKLGDWVKAGGNLWIDGVAGTEDEYGQPYDLLSEVAGIDRQKPVQSQQDNYSPDAGLSGQKPLDTISAKDTTEPIAAIGTKVPLTIASGSSANTLATFADNSPAVVDHRYGKGRCRYVGTLAGLAYGQTAHRAWGKVETDYQESHRQLITGFPLEVGVGRPITCSVPMVEADLLQSDRGTGIVLANYTGQPQPKVELSIAVAARPAVVRSAERGRIPFQYDRKSQRVNISLPLAVVDFVVLEPTKR